MSTAVAKGHARTADPWRDLAVIDARAPRFNQTVIALLGLGALLTGWWPLLGIAALSLTSSVLLGRRWCLPCIVYFRFVQPLVGEGELEDSRPPKFANQIGATVLAVAFIAHLAGWHVLGGVLGGLVTLLAGLAATTGLCVGCELYRLRARLGRRRGLLPEQIDLAELGAAPGTELVVAFGHPLCSDCHRLERQLAAAGRPVLHVDVSRSPQVARRYGISVVPMALAVDGTGRITARFTSWAG